MGCCCSTPPREDYSYSYSASRSEYPKTYDDDAPRQTPLQPGPSYGPKCLRCRSDTTFHITSDDNELGNSGRPYYKCPKCDKFATFADDIGNEPNNPMCFCQLSSRRQQSHPDKGSVWHFVCRNGDCNFWQSANNPRY